MLQNIENGTMICEKNAIFQAIELINRNKPAK